MCCLQLTRAVLPAISPFARHQATSFINRTPPNRQNANKSVSAENSSFYLACRNAQNHFWDRSEISVSLLIPSFGLSNVAIRTTRRVMWVPGRLFFLLKNVMYRYMVTSHSNYNTFLSYTVHSPVQRSWEFTVVATKIHVHTHTHLCVCMYVYTVCMYVFICM